MAKFASNRSENSGSFWLPGFLIHNNDRIVVKPDICSVRATIFFVSSNYNSMKNIALFYHAMRNRLLYNASNNIPYSGVSFFVSAQNPNTLELSRSGIVG